MRRGKGRVPVADYSLAAQALPDYAEVSSQTAMDASYTQTATSGTAHQEAQQPAVRQRPEAEHTGMAGLQRTAIRLLHSIHALAVHCMSCFIVPLSAYALRLILCASSHLAAGVLCLCTHSPPLPPQYPHLAFSCIALLVPLPQHLCGPEVVQVTRAHLLHYYSLHLPCI